MDIHGKILLGLMAFPALIAGILVWLHIQNFRTRHWLEASGRIRSSKAAAKTVRRLDRGGSKIRWSCWRAPFSSDAGRLPRWGSCRSA